MSYITRKKSHCGWLHTFGQNRFYVIGMILYCGWLHTFGPYCGWLLTFGQNRYHVIGMTSYCGWLHTYGQNRYHVIGMTSYCGWLHTYGQNRYHVIETSYCGWVDKFRLNCQSVRQSVRGSLSLRRNPSLHPFRNSFPCLSQRDSKVGPTYRIKSSHYLVLGRPRGLLCPRGIHSVTLIVHQLSFLLATCSAHLCLLSLIMSVTPLFPDPVCTLSVLEGGFYHNSFHLPLSCDQFQKLGFAKRPGLTAVCHC